jgi:diguanylate cyclase (GGDEF)-like protein
MRALASGVSTEAQVIGLYDDAGNQQWLSLSARVLPDPGGDQELMVVCSFSDISVQLEAERRLRWLAYHDPLTGLGNRMLFNSELESALASAKLRERDLAVLFIDLDRFKMVNDSFGHPSGDEVLAELARRFEALVRADDVVSRFSGDEFVVLCRNPPTLAWARELGEKFLEQSTLPIALSTGHSVMLSCCVGVSFIAKGSCSAEEALSQADTAMFSAKKLGKSQVVVFDGKLAVQATHSVASYRDLHKAVGNGEMEVHFQPIANTTDGRVVGVEALTRWVHPVHGVIAPMDFIPLAEDTDLIFSISNWILHEACGAMARWRQGTPGAEDVYVTVNLSGRQFYSTRLADDLSTCLSEVGLGADGLVVEVTEEMLAANPAGAKVVLADLAAIGVRVAVANYGTGYSSLEQLIQSGISMIKIDRSFVSGSLSEAVTGMAAGAALGNALGMTVVAEGVETSAQLVRAKELGCELYQGYLLGRPVHEWQVAFGARGLVGQR